MSRTVTTTPQGCLHYGPCEHPDDSIEQWGSPLFGDTPMQCEEEHDSYSFSNYWMAGDRKAVSFTYPCGCNKKWIRKHGPRELVLHELTLTFTAAGNVDLAIGNNLITLQSADLDEILGWVRARRYEWKKDDEG